MDLDAELALARTAVRRAVDLVTTALESGRSDGPTVTAATGAVQAVALTAIAEEFPADTVRTEDLTAGVDGAAAAALLPGSTPQEVIAAIRYRGGGGDRIWAIDPIDGSKGLSRGDQYAVAMGLIREGDPVLGVLACPRLELSGMRGVVVWGGPGIGAFVESIGEGNPRRLTVSAVGDPARARLLGSVESAHGDPEMIRRVVERLRLTGGWVRLDSQAKYAAVAAGMADLYLRPRNHPEWRDPVWDHAAGAAILAGAGGRVTDLDGRSLDFSGGDLLDGNRGVLASNGVLHERLVAVLAGIG